MSPTASGFLGGLKAPLRSARFLASHPSLRRLAIAPLLINTALFVIAIGVFLANFGQVVEVSTGFLSVADGSGLWHGILVGLASVARWLIGALIFLVFAVAVFFGFSLVGGVIAAPFNEILSMRTEAIVLGRTPADGGGGLASVPREALYAIGTELRRIALYASVAVPIFVLGFVPVVGQVLAPPLGFLVTVHFLAFDYTDPAMSRRHLPFADKRRVLRTQRGAALGFGTVALASLAVPFLNLLLLPVHVVAGTLLYLEWSGEGTPGGREDADPHDGGGA